MPRSVGGSFFTSTVSIASLDRAKDLVKGSLKALHIGADQKPQPECRQPILPQPHKRTKLPGWTPMVILTGAATTIGSSIPVGYNIGVMNTPAHIIREFCNTSISTRYHYDMSMTQLDILWSTIVSIFLIGGVTGSLSGGWIADRFGRRGAVVINNILGLIAAILFVTSRHAQSVEMILLARLFAGLSGGLTTSTVPMYLTEIAPLHIRGAMGVLCPLGLTVGVVVAQVMGLRGVMGSETQWHYLLSLYSVLIVLSAVALPFLPESPKYLYIVRGQEERGIHELSRLRGLPRDQLEDELEDLRVSHKAEKETGGTFSIASVARSKALRLPLLLVCALQAGQQCSGINAVFYYSMTIFENAGLNKEASQYATLGAGGMNFLVAILAIFLVNHYGRRPLALISCTMASVFLIILTISLAYIKEVSWMPYVCIIAVLAYVFWYSIGLGPIPYFIGAELFQVGPRPVAMAYGSMANWGGNFIVGMTFPSLQTLIGEYSFLLFAATTIMLAVFLRYYLPETKNRNPKDIAELLKYGLHSQIHSIPLSSHWVQENYRASHYDMKITSEVPSIEFTDTGSVIIHHSNLNDQRNRLSSSSDSHQTAPKRPESLPKFSSHPPEHFVSSSPPDSAFNENNHKDLHSVDNSAL